VKKDSIALSGGKERRGIRGFFPEGEEEDQVLGGGHCPVRKRRKKNLLLTPIKEKGKRLRKVPEP